MYACWRVSIIHSTVSVKVLVQAERSCGCQCLTSSFLRVSLCRAYGWPSLFVCVSVIHQTNVGEGERQRLIQAVSGHKCFHISGIFFYFPAKINTSKQMHPTEKNHELFIGNLFFLRGRFMLSHAFSLQIQHVEENKSNWKQDYWWTETHTVLKNSRWRTWKF